MRRWDEIKAGKRERPPRPKGLLDGVPRTLPALGRSAANRLESRRRRLRLGKYRPGFRQTERRTSRNRSRRATGKRREIEDELGDLLFVIVNIARFLKVDPEQALRRTNAKFRRRFGHVEAGSPPRQNPSAKRPSTRWKRCGKPPNERTMIEIRAANRHARVRRRRQPPASRSGDSTISTCCPCASSSLASNIGGQVLGAFDGDLMVGFCVAIPGIKPGAKQLSCTATCSAC